MAERDFLLVVNEAAGSGRTERRLATILRGAPDIAARSRIALVGGHADALAAARRLGPTTVPVAVGGDGTVNLLARALREGGVADRPLGVLPLGTGNAFAHEVGADTVQRALRALRAGRIATRDLMITTHPAAPLALLSLSAGLESRFIHEWSQRRDRPGRLGFLVAAARSLTGGRVNVGITVDGQALTDPDRPAYNAGLYNTRHYAFGRRVFPQADPGDGWGEAVVCPTALGYLGVLLGRGGAGDLRSGVRCRRWRHAALTTTGPIQVDGEAVPGGAVDVRIEPAALRVLTAAD